MCAGVEAASDVGEPMVAIGLAVGGTCSHAFCSRDAENATMLPYVSL